MRTGALIAMTSAVVTALLVAMISGGGETHSQRGAAEPVEADLLYRIGLMAEAVHLTANSFAAGHMLAEQAVAMYERQGLGAARSAPALLRLGIIYSKRGYAKQGRECFEAALKLDDLHAPLYLLLSYIYDESAQPQTLTAADRALLRQLRPWLEAYVLPDYHKRAGAPEAALAAEQAWSRRQEMLGLAAGLIVCAWMLLATVGLVIIVRATLRQFLGGEPPVRHPLRGRAPWGLAGAIEAVFALVVLRAAVGALAAALQGVTPPPWRSDVVQAGLNSATYLATVGAALLWMLWRSRRAASARRRIFGLRGRRLGADLWTGVAGYAVWIAAAGLLVALIAPALRGLPADPPAQRALTSVAEARSPAALLVYFVLIVLVGPVLEEVLFRGFVYGGLRTALAPAAAIVLSSAVFATLHAPLGVQQILVVGGVAIVLAALYERTRSLLPSIVAHILHNGLIFAIMAAQAIW